MAQSYTDNYIPLTEREQWLAEQVVDIAFNIHKTLGPGLLESVYEKCFCHELDLRNIPYAKQHCVEIKYNDLVIDDGLRIDILVADLIILELKAQEEPHPVWQAQLLSYLKLTNKRLGYILNFNEPLMKNGIKRMIL
ncbi:MAG TPA: GxxExxY protein [Flavisolibacter sp.]|nr:GxxExxY protein [Flavisolibacter sp.]